MEICSNTVDCNGRKRYRSEEETNSRKYRGVRRRRWGRWVSEIRQPGTKTRIWLGSYDKPEMAARAYDVAALSLKGKSALPNFPHLMHTLPRPASLDPADIQYAAAQAALSFPQQKHPETNRPCPYPCPLKCPNLHSSATPSNVGGSMKVAAADDGGFEASSVNLRRIRTGRECYSPFDEGLEQFDSPNLVMNMAEALLLTPPRLNDLEAADYEYDDEEWMDQPAGSGYLWSNL